MSEHKKASRDQRVCHNQTLGWRNVSGNKLVQPLRLAFPARLVQIWLVVLHALGPPLTLRQSIVWFWQPHWSLDAVCTLIHSKQVNHTVNHAVSTSCVIISGKIQKIKKIMAWPRTPWQFEMMLLPSLDVRSPILSYSFSGRHGGR